LNAGSELKGFDDALKSIEESLKYKSNDVDGLYVKAKCYYELKRLVTNPHPYIKMAINALMCI
jgi:hypothetical protein